MKSFAACGIVTVLVSQIAQADLKTAGTLLVDIQATNLVSLSDGSAVSAWPNSGAVGGSFVPVVTGQGPVFSNNVAGVAAVAFSGSVNSILTNSVTDVSSITGSLPWSVEAWVNNPTLSSSEEVYLTWTPRGSTTGSLMEMRYYNSEIAVEHYYTYLYWNGWRPTANRWNYVVATRDASNVERLYVNGALVYQIVLANTNLRADGVFALGASPADASKTSWTFPYSGFISRIRVQSGTLTSDDVVANYKQDRGLYGQTQTPDTVWTGAPDAEGAWTDSANWRDGDVGGGNGVAITNGGVARVDATVAPLSGLSVTTGGLILTNAASLAVINSPVTLGTGTTCAASLTVYGGTFGVYGTTGTLKLGDTGATATMTLGGDAADAQMTVGGDLFIGNGANGTAAATVGDRGVLLHSNGWLRVGCQRYSQGALTLQSGASVIDVGSSGVSVGGQGASGSVTMNGGLFDIATTLMLSEYTYGSAVVRLNGGRLVTPRVYDGGSASSAFYFNGGTLAVRSGTAYSASFLQGLTNAFVQAGGAVFDVPAPLSVTVAQPLLNDASSAGGGLVKLGDGTLTLTGTNSFTGDLLVGGGALLIRNAAGLIGGYSGTVTLTNSAVIGYETAGGAALLVSRMAPASSGTLVLYTNNAADVIDSSSITNLTIAPLATMTQAVPITTYGHAYVFACTNGTYTYSWPLTDVSGGAAGRLTFNGGSAGRLVLAGDSSFTGGVQINGGTLEMQHANALGAGGQNVTLNGATLKLNASGLSGSFIQDRLTSGSQGLILIGPACSNLSVNVSGYPGLTIGTEEQYLGYSGTITPDDPVYRLGGGNVAYASPYRGLEVSNLTDGASSRTVVVGMPGMVHLMTGNSYSGGTVITNSGVVYLDSDGLGAAPSVPAASNLFVNGGVIRCASATVNLNANRGVAVGPLGASFHIWSTGYMYVLGDLSGSGKVQQTDWGVLGFYGTNNTFAGALTLNNSTPGTVIIGNGSRFSWASSADVTGSNQGGLLVLNTTADKNFASAVKGMIALTKRGTGALTMSASGSNTFSRGLTVEAGTLRLGAAGVIPFGGGASNVEVRAAGAIDLNGRSCRVNGLNGAGLLTNTAQTVQALTLGDNNATSLFAGASAPELRFEKVGTGIHTFAGRSMLTAPTVTAGTLEIATPGWLQTSASLNTNVTLRLKTANGLLGEFADYAASANNASSSGDTNFDSVAAISNLFARQIIALATNSFAAGAGFDFGCTSSNTCVFPGAYQAGSKNAFIARWSGRFYAPIAGKYTFATASDDGSMLFIDGQTVVSNNYFQGYTPFSPRTGSVSLTAGYHAILVAFYEGTGDQGLTVFVTFPGGGQIVLPQSLLDEGTTATNVMTENQLSSALSGGTSATVVKTGLPTMQVLGDNSGFAGLWSLLEGALWVGNGGTSGVLGGSWVMTATNSLLAFQHSDAVTYPSSVMGGGALRQAGSGTLTLTGTNTYTGGTMIDADSTLRVVSPGTLGAGALINNGKLVVAASGTVQQNAIIPVTSVSGNGSVVIESGTLLANGVPLGSSVQIETNAAVVFSATNTYGGGTVLLDGGHTTLALNYAIPGSDTNRWKLNGSAKWTTNSMGGTAIQLTQNAGSLRGSANLYERIATDQPWSLTFRYDVPTKPATPADGMVAFVHADSRGVNALGLSGGCKGYGTNSSVEAIMPSAGFALNLYPSSGYDFSWATNGLEVSKIKGLNGVQPTNGNIVACMRYDGSNTLFVTLTQGANVYATSRTLNLRAVLTNSPLAYVGLSGGTGGATAEQCVSGITVWTAALGSSVSIDQSFATTEGAHATLDCMVNAVGATCSVGTLTLADGSTLDICTNSAAFPDLAYTVAFSQVVLTNGFATINVCSNGTAQGSVGLTTLTVDVGSVLTIKGNIVLPTGSLTVIVPSDFPRGRTLIADLTGATGISASTPFVLSGVSDGSVVYSDGRLYVSRPQGTLLWVR